MKIARASTVADYRTIARDRLPAFLFHYLDGSAGTEVTAQRNIANMEALALRPRVMVNVENVSTATTILGAPLAMPVILGPVGLAGLLARRGEIQAHKAALAAGIPFCLSTLGICSIEELPSSSGDAPWFQLYMFRDREFMADLLDSAQSAWASILLLTVDVPVSGIRHRDRRFGLTAGLLQQSLQVASRPRWAIDVVLRGRPLTFGSIAPALPNAGSLGDFWGWLADNFDPRVTWDDLDFIRSRWRGAIVVKGIMTQEDALAALGAGADGIVVSNHGGRQLDGARSAISVLPDIAEKVAGRIPVLVDGGIRSGIDVVRALALGADACLLGRAWAFALAAGGEPALRQLLADMQREIANTLALTGCRDVASITRSIVDPTHGPDKYFTSIK